MASQTVLVRPLRQMVAAALAASVLACGRIGIDRRDEHGMTALMRAARQGDSVEVGRLLTGGANVNATVPRRDLRELIAFISWMQELPKSDIGYRALHYAAAGGHHGIARLLIKRGADVTHADRGGTTALQVALHRSDLEMMRLLLDARAPIRPQDLWLATSLSTAPAVALLIQRGADVKSPPPERTIKSLPSLPPLAIAAAMRGDADVLRVLVNAGVDLSARDQNGWTPLRWAQQGGRRARGRSNPEELVAILQGAGATDVAGERASALWDAVTAKDTVGVRRALAAGASPNIRDARGEPVLVAAARRGSVDIVAMLVDAGAGVNVNPQNSTTPLIAAIEAGSVEAVRKLIAAGANVQQPDRIRRVPLDIAAGEKQTEIARLLLESQATITPDALPRAALSGSLELVTLLLERGVDVNAGRGHALSESIRACSRNENIEVIRTLLEAGADPKVYGDMSPLSRAAGLCQAEVVRMLLARGADPNAGGEYGWPPLLAAAFDGNLEVVRILIAAKADVNARDRDGKSALQLAARHPMVQEELRAAGAR
jgi:uncharacterized protein